MSRISRGFKIKPYGGMGDTGLLRSAISLFAIRRSTGGVPSMMTTWVGVSSRSMPTMRGPLRWVMPTVPKPGAIRALGSSSDSISWSRVRLPPTFDRFGPTLAAVPWNVWHREHSAAGLPKTTCAPRRESPPVPQRLAQCAGHRLGTFALAEGVQARGQRRRPVGLRGFGEIDLQLRRQLAGLELVEILTQRLA